MDVDVDLVRRHLEEQVHLGAAFLVRGDAVRVEDCVRDGPVLDDAAIDEDVLRPANRALFRKRGDEPVQPHAAERTFDPNQVLAVAVELIKAIGKAGHGWHGDHFPAGAGEREADFGITQCQLRHELRELRGFSGVGLQELAARRQVVKHVRHFDQRAFRTSGLDDGFDDARIHANLGAALAAPRARAQPEVRDRCDRRQRLTAETKSDDRPEIIRALDLAGRVPFEAQPRILGIHADAVVFDANHLLAAVFGGDDDARRLGVDRVLDELFDNGRGPLDHFTGRDLIREIVWQPGNAAHYHQPDLRNQR